ncbi:MAG: hypothetical protein CR972_04745 [Candidatus Moraniibacteriota bacterium]|nr:MAG: hypothetical protein CR972_04745 [Candidatus Moranbacteria bacterium]
MKKPKTNLGTMKQKALILVDLEKEWVNKDSDYFIGDVSSLIDKTNLLISYCRKNDYKIIFTRHIELDSQVEFSKDSENIEILDEINRKSSDIIIEKNKISPFYQTNLEDELKGVEQIVICGILTNLCVRSLVEGAYDRDFAITIITDCCQAFDKETHNFTLKDLKETREEIILSSLAKFTKE